MQDIPEPNRIDQRTSDRKRDGTRSVHIFMHSFLSPFVFSLYLLAIIHKEIGSRCGYVEIDENVLNC